MRKGFASNSWPWGRCWGLFFIFYFLLSSTRLIYLNCSPLDRSSSVLSFLYTWIVLIVTGTHINFHFKIRPPHVLLCTLRIFFVCWFGGSPTIPHAITQYYGFGQIGTENSPHQILWKYTRVLGARI